MILADTSALYALADPEDPWNPQARTALQSILGEGESLLTHSYVIGETVSLIQRRLGFPKSRDFLEGLPAMKVEWVDAVIHEAAVEEYTRHASRHYSFVDCASFVIMRKMGFTKVFTFDGDFAKQGFKVIPSP